MLSRPDYDPWPDLEWREYVKALEGYVDFLEGLLEDRDPLLLW